jgi:hypothetical protein
VSPDEVVRILEALAAHEGLVGVVSRFALARNEVQALLGRAESRAPQSDGAAASERTPIDATLVAASELLTYLAPSLGEEKAAEVLVATSAKLGLSRGPYARADALRILEAMAKSDGVIGVVARFATARFVLKHPA